MIRALIIDDEQLARRGLEIRLEAFADVTVCGQCRNGREALQAVRDHAPDLLFLDVQMPGMDGFEVLRRLSGSDMPDVIFVTAYDEFALRAFESNALDYLLKPINDDRLAEAIDRARRHRDARRADEQRNRLLQFVCELTGRALSLDEALAEATGHGDRYAKRIAIRDGAETRFVDVAAIDWIDAAGDYMCFHADGDTHVMRGTMRQLEELLDPATFVRVHRSTIVNCNRVTAMRAHRNGEYFLSMGGQVELKLSRNYKQNLDRIRSAN